MAHSHSGRVSSEPLSEWSEPFGGGKGKHDPAGSAVDVPRVVAFHDGEATSGGQAGPNARERAGDVLATAAVGMLVNKVMEHPVAENDIYGPDVARKVHSITENYGLARTIPVLGQ